MGDPIRINREITPWNKHWDSSRLNRAGDALRVDRNQHSMKDSWDFMVINS